MPKRNAVPDWVMRPLDPDDVDRLERARRELMVAVNLLGREGVHPALILEAVGDTAAEIIADQLGPQFIKQWFAIKGEFYGEFARELRRKTPKAK